VADRDVVTKDSNSFSNLTDLAPGLLRRTGERLIQSDRKRIRGGHMKAQTQKELGHISASAGKLSLKVESAVIRIRHEERADILVTVNHPENWRLEDGAIRQTKVTGLPNNGVSEIVVVKGDNTTVVVSNISGDGNVVSTTGDIHVDGDKVSVARGADDAAVVLARMDRLEVMVPLSYSGELDLDVDGVHSLQIDFWRGEKLTLRARGSGDWLLDGRFDVTSFTAHCDDLFSGYLEIETLVCRSAIFDIAGKGALNVTALEVGDLVLQLFGKGDATITKLIAETVAAEHRGTGELMVLGGKARKVHFDSFGTGDAVMRGQFDQVSKKIHGSGMISIKAPRRES
jgi:hypothetical protein